MKKLIILLFSLAYCLYLSSILVADIYSQKSQQGLSPQGTEKEGTVPVKAIDKLGQRGLSLTYINLAITLNPLNSDYYYQKYTLLKAKKGLSPKGTVPELQSAIELEPTKPAYHMFYALVLLKIKEGTVPAVGIPDTEPRGLSLNLKGPALDSIIKQEFYRAVTLKPFSKQYRKILNDYLPYLKP